MVEERRRRRSMRFLPAGGIAQPFWTMDVEAFGKISKAQIAMAPLVIFVGRNNTGKSHLASLIWAMQNLNQTSVGWPEAATPTWFSELFSKPTPDSKLYKHRLSDIQLDQVQADLNEVLKKNKNKICREVLSYKASSIKVLRVGLPLERYKIEITAEYLPPGRGGKFDWEVNDGILSANIGSPLDDDGRPQFGTFFYSLFLLGLLTGGAHPASDAGSIYIPAARTGLMLAFRTLVSRLLGNLRLGQAQQSQGDFSLPLIKFLQALNDAAGKRDARYDEIALSIEERILQGQIDTEEGSSPLFTYHPKGARSSLPLHVSSSMVTELAPFMILLRSGELASGVIFEEPEAHLHLDAQRAMAKAIARLVNLGIPVVVTTHSDTFIQQINLSMELHGNHDRNVKRKFGYDDVDTLDPCLARAYEFICKSGKTTVVELDKVGASFVVPSINDTIETIANEVSAITSEVKNVR